MKVTSLMFAILLALTGTAVAQNAVFAVTPHAKNGVAPAICSAQVTKAKELILSFPHPAKWTWYIACDDVTWNNLIRRIGDNNTDWAATLPNEHVTIVRGMALLHQIGDHSATEVIAHELAHIFLHTGDERRVDDLTNAWLGSFTGTALSLSSGH